MLQIQRTMSNNCEIKNMLVQQLVLLLIVLTKFSVKCVMFSVGPCLFNAFESCEANDIHYYLYSSDQPKIPFRVDNSNIEVSFMLKGSNIFNFYFCL